MRYRGTALSILLLISVSAAARADDGKPTYEAAAKGATRVDRAGLAGLLWSLSASCSEGDDLGQRQCRAIRNARARRLGTQTFIVPGDASAFTVGAFDSKKKSVPLSVTGCIACVETITVDGVDGQSLYVLSDNKGASFQGAVARAAMIHETTRAFADDEAAVKWRTEVVPRLRTEFVVKLGASSSWKRDGKQGVAVEILGFRVWDPCSGGIVCASPKSGKAGVDKVACGGAVVEGEAGDAEGESGGKVVKDKAVVAVPDELTARQIKEAMKGVRESADLCFEKYGIAGDAKLRVTVAADGAVIALEQTGDFQDTPTGTCIENAVKAATFPKTKKSRQSFSYPIVLR